jgi:hypothetical protein
MVMAGEKWQYSILTQAIPVGNWIEEVDHDSLARNFMEASLPSITNMNQAASNPPPGTKDVEYLSHSIVRMGSTLLLTILMRHHNA